MILTTHVDIKIYPANINYFKKIGYHNIKKNDIITIPIKYLKKTSKIKIKIKCDVCGIEKESFYFAYLKYLDRSIDNKYRCGKCVSEIRKQTNMEKYGVESVMQLSEVKQKRKENFKEKYGVIHYNKLDFFKDKIKKTSLINNGVEYPMQNIKIKEKQQKTTKERYGVSCSLQNNDVKNKTLLTMNEKYGCDYSMQNNDLKNLIISNGLETRKNNFLKQHKDILSIENNNYKIFCLECNEEFIINSHLYLMRNIQQSTLCTNCNPINSLQSDKENQLLKFISNNYKYEIITSDRKILKPYELDIYLPDLKLAFEFNGLYWHNELYKDKKYHLNKTEECLKKNIQLIHIWEDDWNFKQDIVKSMILNKLNKSSLKIYGRKTEIKEVTDNKLIKTFLNKNHLQGFIGSKVKLGLFYENELVSLMTFGEKRLIMKSKSKSEFDYEMLRFCNKLNTNVIGGASKLFKFFIRNYNPKEIITYADRSHSNGNLYEKLGLNFIHKTQPNYFYIVDKTRKYRFNYRKNILISQGYDKNMSEHEIMLSRNIYRIYDSGSLKYIFNQT